MAGPCLSAPQKARAKPAAAQSAPAKAPPKQAAAEASKAAPPPAATPPARPLDTTTVLPREIAHTKRLDEIIAPARDHAVPADDLARIRDGARAATGGTPDKARALEAQIRDPAGRKLVQWLRLRDGGVDPAEIKAFLDANPAWPDRALLTRRMEEGLFRDGGSPAAVIALFAEREPATGAGFAALASAHLAGGNEDRARELAAKAWREDSLPANFEPQFLARLGKLLSTADHKWRFDRLVSDDLRWTKDRAARAAVARRVLPLLPPDEKSKALARLAVFLRTGGKKALDAPAGEGTRDWGLVFHRVQQLRRSKKFDEAAKLLIGAPTTADRIANLDGWWGERRALAYEMLAANKPKAAYDLVREAGPLSVNPLKEQTFMAGWIALRYLKDRDAAETHLTAMQKAADGPQSRAKAAYWLGRAAEAKGGKEAAREHYRLAAREPDTFHAMLARQKLEPGRQAIDIEPPALPSAEQAANFNALDAVRAAAIAHKAGLDVSIPRVFLYHLRSVMKTEAETGMVAHLAEAMGDTQTAVRIAKAAVAQGHNLIYYSYPVHPFPNYSPLRRPPEKAFLLGVARQESEFNTLTVSGAGAKGLLQVMGITARHVCRDYKIKCELNRLLTDKPYNTMLASAYIADRMGEFSGSYVLGLAGYNAGPGRARQWIKAFGDPRDPKIDPIDWIERIPFQETREYVAKVLSNIQMYRARLGTETALRLEDDLVRGRAAAKAAGSARAAGASEE